MFGTDRLEWLVLADRRDWKVERKRLEEDDVVRQARDVRFRHSFDRGLFFDLDLRLGFGSVVVLGLARAGFLARQLVLLAALARLLRRPVLVHVLGFFLLALAVALVLVEWPLLGQGRVVAGGGPE